MKRNIRIAVTGGRNFNNTDLVKSAFQFSPDDSITIVHGGCRGADLLCKQIAENLGLKTEEWPADWKSYGKAAGPIRNLQMLKSGIDILYVFPGGRGTQNCYNQALKLGIPIKDFRKGNNGKEEY